MTSWTDKVNSPKKYHFIGVIHLEERRHCGSFGQSGDTDTNLSDLELLKKQE